ncbi:MAG: hypothetical protein U1E29_16605 [Coriobacteriia bacterium]|nr:hypothetical protein [Coriobacteriia bacterium]
MATQPENLIVEYEALRAEISSNSNVVANVFAITITGVAALIGYGIETLNWMVLLAPFALLIPSLWFVASQIESTVRIATYIRTFIEPRAEGLAWETRLHSVRAFVSRPDSRYTLSITGIYGLLGVACLALAWALAARTPTEVIVLSIATVVLGSSTLFVSHQCRRALSSSCQKTYDEQWTALAARIEKSEEDPE